MGVFHVFNLYKWYQVAQSMRYYDKNTSLTLQTPTPQSGQTNSNNFSAKAYVECLSVSEHFVRLTLKRLTKQLLSFLKHKQATRLTAPVSDVINGEQCVKSLRIQSYSGPHFPTLRLNKKRYGVSLCIQSEYGKMRIIITPNTDTFYAVENSSKGYLK